MSTPIKCHTEQGQVHSIGYKSLVAVSLETVDFLHDLFQDHQDYDAKMFYH